ncbi:hypothetical protein ACWGN5_11475 [Streptomyces sp. NPDC055815]
MALSRRLKELAPESAEADRVEAVERWARRGYWDDLRWNVAREAVATRETHGATVTQARALTDALAKEGHEAALAAARAAEAADPTDREAAVRAAMLEALAGPWNAPVRFLGRYRPAVWAVSVLLVFVTNQLLRQTGVVDSFSPWGYLWLVPVLLVDRRFAAVRREAEAHYLARLESNLAPRT